MLGSSRVSGPNLERLVPVFVVPQLRVSSVYYVVVYAASYAQPRL